MAYGVVYLVRNRNNGKCYVGQTTQVPEVRFEQHRKRKGSHCKALAAAIAKHGHEAFEFTVIYVAAHKADIDEAERRLIAEHGAAAPAGYNIKEGGSWGTHSPETRAAISASNKGKTIPDSQRRASSERMTGTSPSVETRAKISAKLTGRKLDEELCTLMSICGLKRHVEKPFSDASKALMSKNRSGIPVSNERKQHLSRINTGKKHSEQTKAAMSASQREAWARRRLLKNNQSA